MFRTKVKVVSLSDRIKGTKDNGKSYDFAKAAVEFTNEYGISLLCLWKNVGANDFAFYEPIRVA